MERPVAALDSGANIRLICRQAESDLTGLLRPAFLGQTFDNLQTPMLPDPSRLGAVNCYLVSLPGAYLMVAPGCDGVVLDSCHRPILETTHFSNPDDLRRETEQTDNFIDLKEPIFVSIDTAWFNYFHWICFGIGKAALADSHLDDDHSFAFPDYDAYRGTERFPRYGRDVMSGGLGILNTKRRQRVLMPGLYRAPMITFVATDPPDPTAVTHLRDFFQAFAVADVKPSGGLSRRALILREKLPRLTPEVIKQLKVLSHDRGFDVNYLERMSFRDQVSLFANAEAVISPHGAGLTNVLFGKSTLKVLEVNSDFNVESDGSGGLRPWFYILARGKEQSYIYLNASNGEVTPERLGEALDQLTGS